MPRIFIPNSTFSRTVFHGNSEYCWNTMPRSALGPLTASPSTVTVPVVGFLKPTTGTVTVDGEAVKGPSAERGMVFQQYSLFPWKTVRENVEFGMKMRGMDRSARERAARTLLG